MPKARSAAAAGRASFANIREKALREEESKVGEGATGPSAPPYVGGKDVAAGGTESGKRAARGREGKPLRG
jgi:hypothetical protein